MNTEEKKKLFLITLSVILLIMITVGLTYSIFAYTKLGTTDNTITSGILRFQYLENTKGGAGINIENAFPVSDQLGKNYESHGYVFDFKITATNTGSEAISYEVTLRENENTTLDGSFVKVYLTDTTNSNDIELLTPTKFSFLENTKIDVGKYNEKTLYQNVVAGNQKNYEKDFRLRMWIDENTDISSVDYINKTFSATVNVYANTNVVTLNNG